MRVMLSLSRMGNIYAGIGSRHTPPDVLALMTNVAETLQAKGWHLHSGGASGADEAFERGAGNQKTIFVPWYKFRQRVDGVVLPAYLRRQAEQEASQVHPAWSKCSQGARKLHARNVAILKGACLDAPVRMVICWTYNGYLTGGTALGIRLAQRFNIPVYNLGLPDQRQSVESIFDA